MLRSCAGAAAARAVALPPLMTRTIAIECLASRRVITSPVGAARRIRIAAELHRVQLFAVTGIRRPHRYPGASSNNGTEVRVPVPNSMNAPSERLLFRLLVHTRTRSLTAAQLQISS